MPSRRCHRLIGQVCYLASLMLLTGGVEGEQHPKKVLVEICESGLPGQNAWPDRPPAARESFQEEAFAFIRIPVRYNDQGVREDRANPLILRATADVKLPAGRHRLLLRSRRAARLWVDGELVGENAFPVKITDGHDPVERPFLDIAPDLRFAAPGDQEQLVEFRSPGRTHRIRYEAFVGGHTGKNRLRPELGETSVGIAYEGDRSFRLLSPARKIPLTDAGWQAFRDERFWHFDRLDTARRRAAQQLQADYWRRRHDYARRVVVERTAAAPPGASSAGVDEILAQDSDDAGKPQDTTTRTDDLRFLRRVYLDTVGVIPTRAEIDSFRTQQRPDKRARLIDRLLQDPRWADHWVSYWQDVLAENPSIINPTLNNTGPFRWWIHESFLDNKPLDRFVTELVMMSGSERAGGPAGFSMATQNDLPMAAKANILSTAFLGVQMKCSRCHDAPYHANTQHGSV